MAKPSVFPTVYSIGHGLASINYRWFYPYFKALDILHAERIGHGYNVLQVDALYRRVIDEKIHLEVSYNCP